MWGKRIKIAPSILSADFAFLGRDIARAEAGGADYIHVDVMDGHFVPNITVGIPVVKSLKASVSRPLDVHLMISDPSQYAERFVEAGANILTFHLEAVGSPGAGALLKQIRTLGAKAALSIKPATPVSTLESLIPFCDQVLIMTVEPGFGGQGFIPNTMDKIRQTRAMIDRLNPECDLEIDGGVGTNNIRACVAAGANVIVAGSAAFKKGIDPAELVASLHAAAFE
jgi:ribulose-phosphate 3-epimerase